MLEQNVRTNISVGTKKSVRTNVYISVRTLNFKLRLENKSTVEYLRFFNNFGKIFYFGKLYFVINMISFLASIKYILKLVI